MARDERTAISQMQRGDIRGLDTLMRAYQVRAIRAAHLVTHDLPLAEDIVQSAFIRAFERIGQFDASRPFGPWFLRSVVNSATTAVSRRGRFERRNGSAAHDTADDAVSGEEETDALPDPDPGPEARILGAETRDAVWQALESLPPAQRAAIVLRYYLELPEAETAARLGVPAGTVKSRLSAARGRLRVVLGSQAPTAHDRQSVSSSTGATSRRDAEEVER
jgi:RNA polymerase sigma-70 factor (ECF subfamily)